MVEVGIPVYKARKTLSKALDSLVAQTKSMFFTCLSIDGDNEDYSDIIEMYRARGLKIRIINAPNGGPGMARQRIIDSTQCDYLIFLDADDMLMPNAVEMLYAKAKTNDCDIAVSNFMNESNEILLGVNSSVTWTHGKIYRTAFLRNKNICFIPELRNNEDAYFNLVAFNCTDKIGYINYVTSLWRDNRESITRINGAEGFFKNNPSTYIFSQVKALSRIYELTGTISTDTIALTLVNIYNSYMRNRFYDFDTNALDTMLSEIANTPWLIDFTSDQKGWQTILDNVRCGVFIEDKLVFFKENFYDWFRRVLIYENSSC